MKRVTVTPKRPFAKTVLICILLLAAASAVGADWLVTREGARIETKGEWKVKGRAVVFTRPNGTLSSMRLDEVDLEASEAANAAVAAGETQEEEAPPKEPVLVLTNADISHREPPSAPSGGGESEEGGEGQTQGGGGEQPFTADGPVIVISTQETRLPLGIGVEGTLRNNGTAPASISSVNIKILDINSGEELGERQADTGTDTLRPSQATRFVTAFPGIEPGTVRLRIHVISALLGGEIGEGGY